MDDRIIAILERTWLFVYVLGFLLADFVEALIDVLIGDFGFRVGDDDAAVVAQVELGRDLELGFKLERLAGVEMNVGNIRRADHLQVLLLHCRAKCLGDDLFEHVLTYIAGKSRLDQVHGRVAGPEPGQPDFFLDLGDNALRFLFNVGYRDGDLQGVPTTLN